MRKRLRKKLRLREFTQLCFTASYRVKSSFSTDSLDSLLDRFILEAIESNDLSCGGGGGPTDWEFIVCPCGRRSASEGDLQRVRFWLESQEEIDSAFVGHLQDAWNGSDDDDLVGGSHAEHAA